MWAQSRRNTRPPRSALNFTRDNFEWVLNANVCVRACAIINANLICCTGAQQRSLFSVSLWLHVVNTQNGSVPLIREPYVCEHSGIKPVFSHSLSLYVGCDTRVCFLIVFMTLKYGWKEERHRRLFFSRLFKKNTYFSSSRHFTHLCAIQFG